MALPARSAHVGSAVKLTGQLNFPTSIALGKDGAVYVAESGLPFDGAPPGGTVSRVHADGSRMPLATGLRPPVNGLSWHDDSLIISEGGRPGRLSRLCLNSGAMSLILDGLPGFGNYQTNMAVVGPDGKLYFSQGALTNTGVIGADSRDLAWLRTVPHACDIPGYDIVLAESNAFAPFGAEPQPGRRIAGSVPCTAAVMRCDLDGSNLELVAWGLRNAYGMGFLRDGRLLATEQGADARGSRPVFNCPDFLYEVRPAAWYGWPDFFGGEPIASERFAAPDGTRQQFVLTNHAALPPPARPLATFDVNACAVKFVELCGRDAGSLLVALFGDERPLTGPAGDRVGRQLVRVSLADGTMHPTAPLPCQRPIDLALDPDGNLYVVDFGEFEIAPGKGIVARAATGCIWKFPGY
jgi:glucose/arabinose dehydrogenase